VDAVVVDGDIVSSRDAGDLPAFCRAIVEQFARTPERVS
jgi:protease I